MGIAIESVKNEKPCLVKRLFGEGVAFLDPGEHQLLEVNVFRATGKVDRFFVKYIEKEGGSFGLGIGEWLLMSKEKGVKIKIVAC